MGKIAVVVMAVTSAGMAAVLFGNIVHDQLGIPLTTIRMDALSAAGLITAAVACGSLLTWKR
jgi:hypothetical protein